MARQVAIADLKKEGRARRVALYAAALWAVVDTVKKIGPMWPAAFITAVVMLAMLIYALVVEFWWLLLLGTIGYITWKYLKYRRDAYKPVPWDDDYRPSQDDEIPY